MPIHHETYKIRSNETVANQTLSLPALAGMLQEAAWEHSIRLGASVYELLKRGLSWALFRLTFQMNVYPKLHDHITIRTWPSGYDRRYLFRDFRIESANGELLGQIKSVWVVFDIKMRRAAEPPDFIRQIGIQQEIQPVASNASKIPTADHYDNVKIFNAGWHDIDLNQHVNNISYIRWIIETLPVAALSGKMVETLDVVFLAESGLGDSIRAMSQETGDDRFLHKLVPDPSGKELALASTRLK